MRASVSTALKETHQEVDLAFLLIPETVFLVLASLALLATLISLECEFGVLNWFDARRACGFDCFTLSLYSILLSLTLFSGLSLYQHLHRIAETILEIV